MGVLKDEKKALTTLHALVGEFGPDNVRVTCPEDWQQYHPTSLLGGRVAVEFVDTNRLWISAKLPGAGFQYDQVSVVQSFELA